MNKKKTLTFDEKNISVSSNNIKRKHSNTYEYFQNYSNTIRINTIP